MSKLIEDDNTTKEFINANLITPTIRKMVQCSQCHKDFSVKSIDKEGEYWYCPTKHRNKLQNEKEATHYEWNLTAAHKLIERRLKEIGQTVYNDVFWKINIDEKSTVACLAEIASGIVLKQVFENGGLVIYLNEYTIKRVRTVLTKPIFVSIIDLVKLSAEDLGKKLTSATNPVLPKFIEVEDLIRKFAQTDDSSAFEVKCTELLNRIKQHSKKINSQLTFLKEHSGSPMGVKFVLLGSNYPSDILPLFLGEYLDDCLTVSKEQGYDAKKYTVTLSKQIIDEKRLSNHGRRLLFITTSDKIQGAVWKIVYETRRTNPSAAVLVMDLELLTWLTVVTDSQDLFQEE